MIKGACMHLELIEVPCMEITEIMRLDDQRCGVCVVVALTSSLEGCAGG